MVLYYASLLKQKRHQEMCLMAKQTRMHGTSTICLKSGMSDLAKLRNCRTGPVKANATAAIIYSKEKMGHLIAQVFINSTHKYIYIYIYIYAAND
jgi:hypothetical protein